LRVRRLRSGSVSLSTRAEKLGMLPDVVTVMQQQIVDMQRVYELLRERTGIRVAAVVKLSTDSSRVRILER
jgi:hypothetical protein